MDFHLFEKKSSDETYFSKEPSVLQNNINFLMNFSEEQANLQFYTPKPEQKS